MRLYNYIFQVAIARAQSFPGFIVKTTVIDIQHQLSCTEISRKKCRRLVASVQVRILLLSRQYLEESNKSIIKNQAVNQIENVGFFLDQRHASIAVSIKQKPLELLFHESQQKTLTYEREQLYCKCSSLPIEERRYLTVNSITALGMVYRTSLATQTILMHLKSHYFLHQLGSI